MGYRTETYANRTHWVYGYQMGALSRVAPEDAPGSVPHLIDRIFLVPGNEAGLPETVEALDSLKESGAPVREVLVDKGYSQAAFDDFSGPMHERNIDIVMDLKKDQHRVVPNDKIGYLILDGQAFCPTLPPRLRNLHLVEDLTAKNPEGRTHITAEEQQAWDERAAARKEFMQLIAERNTYRLESKGPARNGKGIRYVCPVTTGRLDVSTHPAPHLRKECCRKSITIPFSVHGKLRQKHVWGTREWFRSYARRTAVERFFGNIKGLTGIMRAGWTLQVGLVKLQLMTAITVMAHNLKTLLRWTKAHGANGSFIASIDVAEVEIIDPSPGIDPASLPEHLQPA